MRNVYLIAQGFLSVCAIVNFLQGDPEAWSLLILSFQMAILSKQEERG